MLPARQTRELAEAESCSYRGRLCGSSSWLQSAWILLKASDVLVTEGMVDDGVHRPKLSGFIPIGCRTGGLR